MAAVNANSVAQSGVRDAAGAGAARDAVDVEELEQMDTAQLLLTAGRKRGLEAIERRHMSRRP
jgi:hypothetical protein